MPSPSRSARVHRVWRVAILGTIAAAPATVVVNWLPSSEATVGGGAMLIGPLIAGAVATSDAVEPDAAGLRGGFLGGLVAISAFVLTEARAVAWSLNTAVFFGVACLLLLCLSPVFGLVCGRIGGWTANAVAGIRADN